MQTNGAFFKFGPLLVEFLYYWSTDIKIQVVILALEVNFHEAIFYLPHSPGEPRTMLLKYFTTRVVSSECSTSDL
jgi:hypothetical protein